jgi:hypothetical protein
MIQFCNDLIYFLASRSVVETQKILFGQQINQSYNLLISKPRSTQQNNQIIMLSYFC